MDWTNIRNNYPLLENKTYLRNASIAATHRDVLQVHLDWVASIAKEGATNEDRFFHQAINTKKAISNFLNVKENEVAIGQNTSHNFNIIAQLLLDQTKNRKIIAPADEFPSSILPFIHHGFNFHLIKSTNGKISEDELLNAIDSETAAVVCSASQFQTGFRINLEYIGKNLKQKNIPFIVNATQAIGAFKINPHDFHASALSSSCHKWLGGPMGASLLFINEEFFNNAKIPQVGWFSVEEPWLLKNEKQNTRKEVAALQLGTLPFPMYAAVEKSLNVINDIGIENISNRILDLSDLLYQELRKLPVTFNTDRTNRVNNSGTINFTPNNFDSEKIVQELEKDNIFINTRRGTCRASIHFYNNEQDIKTFIEKLRQLILPL